MRNLSFLDDKNRIKIFKRCRKTLSQHQQVTFNKISKDSITNFTVNFIGVAMFVGASLPPVKLNSIPSASIDAYPNYLWAYAFHFTIHVCVNILSIVVMYAKNPGMWKALKRGLREVVSNQQPCNGTNCHQLA